MAVEDLIARIMQATEAGEGIIGGIHLKSAATDAELSKFKAELEARGINYTITGHTIGFREPKPVESPRI